MFSRNKNRSSLRSRQFGVEQLESRRVFAGNVMAQVVDGDLLISGDNASNGVQIFQAMQQGQPMLGRYFIAGATAGGAATTINGLTGVTVSGVTDDIRINLNGGSDSLQTGAVRLVAASELNIDMGEGNNRVTLDLVDVRDDLTITTRAGNDNVFVRGTVGRLANSVDSDLRISTGEGSDSVLLQNFFVRNDVQIDTGSGEFADTVQLFTGNVGDDMVIATGGGADTVTVSGVGVNDDLKIATGSGRDRVFIDNSQADELFAHLGSGDDRLEISDTFGRRATLEGELGFDTLAESNVAFTEDYDTSGF